MVDRAQTKLLLLFLTVLVSFSAMSVAVLAEGAILRFNATDINIGTNFTNNTGYNATNSFRFSANVTNGTNAIATNVTLTVCSVSGSICYNFTASSTGLNSAATANASLVTAFGTRNESGVGVWTVNISQPQLGRAGQWNLTWSAWVNATLNGYAAGAYNFSDTQNFTIASYNPNITLAIDEANQINQNVTTNYGGTPTSALRASFNVTNINSTGEQLFVTLFSNITGFVTSVAAGTNSTNITVFNQTTVPADTTTGWNRTYNITAFWPGNQNISSASVTVYLTAKDNLVPTVSISKPTTGTYYDSAVTLKFSGSDNVGFACEYWLDSGSSKGASQGTDITVSSLSASDHTLNVKCTDYSSNAATTSVKFTASPAVITPAGGGVSAPVVSSSGGGATGAPEKTQVFIAKVSANAKTSIAIPTGDVSEISLTVKNSVTSVYINVNKLSDVPTGVSAPSGKVFRYLDIKPSGLDDSNIASAKIKFKVDKSWITANNIDSSKIVLARFNNNVWNNLDTTKSSEDTTTITFEATTPGFSTFAITTGEAAAGAPGTAPTTPGKAPVTAPTTPGKAPVTAPTGELPLTAIAIVVVVVIVAVVLLRAGVI